MSAGNGAESPLDAASPGLASEDGTDPQEVLASVMDKLTIDGEFAFDDEIVKQNLDEILVALIALRDGTHGKALIEDLDDLFDAQLSPGTVYPRLHDIKNEGVLSMHELVRTKEYSVEDVGAAEDRIREAMYHHLVLGLFLHDSLDDL